MYEYYKSKICSVCKNNNCHITVFSENGAIHTKCVNYKKDESKIEGYRKPLVSTAKIQKTVMPKLISD